MQGFDPKFTDFPGYIIDITKEIWENRGIATLHNYYAPDIIVRSPTSIVEGNQGVIAATMATLSEFPDRTLLGEDVIWSGNETDGLLSSHRIFSTATHERDGVYGKATGTKLGYRIIADCHAHHGVINDEWLIRDQGAIARQLGIHPKDFVLAQIEAEGGTEASKMPFQPHMDKLGPYKGKGNDNAWGERYKSVLLALMGADFTVVNREYDRAAELFLPGGVVERSHQGADKFWMGLRSSFPSAEFKIHHVIGREDEFMPPRAAIRWSLDGKHDGWGAFGQPTGSYVHIMGISHVEYGRVTGNDCFIRKEYNVFDELAIWKQILLGK